MCGSNFFTFNHGYKMVSKPNIYRKSKAFKFIVLAVIYFLLQISLPLTYAQQDRNLRDLQELAKKHDEQQQKERVAELERRLNGGGSENPEFYIKAILWFALVYMVGYFIYRRYENKRVSKIVDQQVKEHIREAFDKAEARQLEPLTKEEISKLSLDEIANKINKSKTLVRITLGQLGWVAKDFDGAKVKSAREEEDLKYKSLVDKGVGSEKARELAKRQLSYKRELDKLKEKESQTKDDKFPIHITLFSKDSESQLIWYVACFGEECKLIKGYSLFSEGASEIEKSGGFQLERNIDVNSYFDPMEAGANTTISIYGDKLPKTSRYISVFLSASADMHKSSRVHSHLRMELKTSGFFSTGSNQEWNFQDCAGSQLFLGMIDLRSVAGPTFVQAKNQTLPIPDKDVFNDEETGILMPKYQEISRQLVIMSRPYTTP
jgi:hypothetical protein